MLFRSLLSGEFSPGVTVLVDVKDEKELTFHRMEKLEDQPVEVEK